MKRPNSEIVPTVELPPVIPLTCHVKRRVDFVTGDDDLKGLLLPHGDVGSGRGYGIASVVVIATACSENDGDERPKHSHLVCGKNRPVAVEPF